MAAALIFGYGCYIIKTREFDPKSRDKPDDTPLIPHKLTKLDPNWTSDIHKIPGFPNQISKYKNLLVMKKSEISTFEILIKAQEEADVCNMIKWRKNDKIDKNGNAFYFAEGVFNGPNKPISLQKMIDDRRQLCALKYIFLDTNQLEYNCENLVPFWFYKFKFCAFFLKFLISRNFLGDQFKSLCSKF